MTDRISDIVIVGGGLAGARAAAAARAHGFAGNLTLIAEEAERPYERPPLSKEFLLGEKTVEETYVHPAGFYAEHDIDLRLHDPAIEIDRGGGAVLTRSGRALRFDRLLLATGAAPRRLALADADPDNVAVLRTLDDSRRLADRLRAVDHVTVVGAGWIGCEVAAAARTLGTRVTMIDPHDVPLAGVLGSEVGQVFADLHTEHGVDLRTGVRLTSVRSSDTATCVRLTDDTEIDTDLVVVGIGVAPRTELAERAGLEVEDGVVVDDTLTTSDRRILAAGDVARAWHPRLGSHLRVEHWANALNQGTVAGRNLLGAAERYDRLPYFFSDQYDLGMEYSGHADAWDRVVFRGSRDERKFIAFWLHDGRAVAGMNVNVWDVTDDIQQLIVSRRRVDPAGLADPRVPLADFVQQ